MKVSTEIDNNFGYEKITQLVDNIPLREQLGQRFTFFKLLSNDDGQYLQFSLKKDGKWEQG